MLPVAALTDVPDVTASANTCKSIQNKSKLPFTITSLGFGGTALKFSKYNNQLSVMNGGRGSATINHHFTIGGGGYGISNRIEVETSIQDTFISVGMGYGGLEIGYLLLPDTVRANVGISLLFAAGAAFIETLPKRRNNSFSMFPVIEPAVYWEFAFTRLIHIHTGATYRIVIGSDLDYVSDKNMRGMSGYINLLFGTCNCDHSWRKSKTPQ